jgi:hypothetical protein
VYGDLAIGAEGILIRARLLSLSRQSYAPFTSFQPGCDLSFSCCLPCSHSVLTLFSIGSAKVQHCPAGSHISYRFLA